MIKRIFATLVLSVLLLSANAQPTGDSVIFEIGGKPYYKSQFMKDFLLSVGKDPKAAPTACTYEKRKALEDYASLYVNFQCKLLDAYAQGLDTLPDIIRELRGYRNELAAPYLIDSATLSDLLHEAYDRNHYVLHAAHILVPCKESALPEDSLKAYQHAMEILARAQAGEDFYTLAQEEMRAQRLTSRDPEIRKRAEQDNPMEGDLGCFTVFDMIYAFECQAYAMQPGEIGWVRTKYGYHVIKLFERMPHYGKLQLAHIWIPEGQFAENRIKMARKQIADGEDFAMVAKNYSGDRQTSTAGGVMPELAPNQLPYAYIDVVSKGLKVGEVSEPFHTRFGWHIVKLLSKEEMPSFETLAPQYKSRMTRGERAAKPKNIFIEQCKKKYSFVDYTTVRETKSTVVRASKKSKKKKDAPYLASLQAVRALVTDSVFSAIFSCDTASITDLRPLFKIGDQEYDSRDFAQYLLKNKHVSQLCDLDIYVQNRYHEFIDAMVFNYADGRLEKDNPEFGELVEEYLHGLMIFTYNDRMVWGRAVKDSVGFSQFCDMAMVAKGNSSDPADSVYFWKERADLTLFTIADSLCLTPEKAAKLVEKALAKGVNVSDIQNRLAAKINKKKCDSQEPVSSEVQLVEKGRQKVLDANEWRKGVFVRPAAKGYQILVVSRILEPELKTKEEARGFYLNDYQNFLEQQNNAALRAKYGVKVHQDVIDEITY